MKPFTFKFGQDPWPDGLSLLHVYALPDLSRDSGLAALIGACREATRGEPLAHVPDKWLHVTLCQIAIPAGGVSGSDRANLAAEIGQRMAGITPFTVTLGNPVCVRTGILLDVAAGVDQLERVRADVALAVGAVLGPSIPLTGVEPPLHLTESYAYGDADDDRIRAKLATVAPGEALMPVDAVELVDVSVNQETKNATWQQLARIPL